MALKSLAKLNTSKWEVEAGRSRGVCDVILYVNTGETELEFMAKLKDVKYSDILAYIDFLKYLQKLQQEKVKSVATKNGKLNLSKNKVVTELGVIFEEWTNGVHITSRKQLNDLIAEKSQNVNWLDFIAFIWSLNCQ